MIPVAKRLFSDFVRNALTSFYQTMRYKVHDLTEYVFCFIHQSGFLSINA